MTHITAGRSSFFVVPGKTFHPNHPKNWDEPTSWSQVRRRRRRLPICTHPCPPRTLVIQSAIIAHQLPCQCVWERERSLSDDLWFWHGQDIPDSMQYYDFEYFIQPNASYPSTQPCPGSGWPGKGGPSKIDVWCANPRPPATPSLPRSSSPPSLHLSLVSLKPSARPFRRCHLEEPDHHFCEKDPQFPVPRSIFARL